MGYGKGKDFYKSTYSQEQLWNMLQEGDDWGVDQGGSIWVTAASGMKAAREEMVVHVQSLRTQWTGTAADEFENRMAIVEEYSRTSEDGMKDLGELTLPALAQALKTAQTDAASEDLYPSSTQTYEEWLDSNGHSETDPDYQTKKPQYEQQYQQYLDARHDRMAQIVADLGDKYAYERVVNPIFAEPPPPPPSDMPGNSTYQPPTGGVFAENGLTNSNDVPDAPGAVSGADTAGADGVLGTDDDLDPVTDDWMPGSYDDIDGDVGGGGLAHGYMPGGGGGTGYMPAGGGTGAGGASLLGGGAGLFGPATSGGGAGSAPGRGTGNTSPARAGASSGTSRSGSGTGGRGGLNSGGGTGNRAGAPGGRSGTGARGGTRSGYNDEDDEDTYTRETWLREDDVDWSRNRVRDEELDDD